MARKYRHSGKFTYDQAAKKKKSTAIVLAVVLALSAIAVILFFIFSGSSGSSGETPPFTVLYPPNKTTYFVGEEAVWDGFRARLITESGTSILNKDKCTFSGFDSSAPAENQVITVTYEQYTATFYVTIAAQPDDPAAPDNGKPTDPNSKPISMIFGRRPQTEYTVGQPLDLHGGVLHIQYDDGSTREVDMESSMISGFDSTSPGFRTLTVTYTEKGRTLTLTYDISVNE